MPAPVKTAAPAALQLPLLCSLLTVARSPPAPPQAYSSDFAFLPIPPRPGDLWVFPGYLPHAVLPRTLPQTAAAHVAATCAEEAAAEEPAAAVRCAASSSLRISVACNVLPSIAKGLKEQEHGGGVADLVVQKLLRGRESE